LLLVKAGKDFKAGIDGRVILHKGT
jgi:hypothetical protein